MPRNENNIQFSLTHYFQNIINLLNKCFLCTSERVSVHCMIKHTKEIKNIEKGAIRVLGKVNKKY